MAGALQSWCCECMRSPSGGNEGRRNCENVAPGVCRVRTPRQGPVEDGIRLAVRMEHP